MAVMNSVGVEQNRPTQKEHQTATETRKKLDEEKVVVVVPGKAQVQSESESSSKLKVNPFTVVSSYANHTLYPPATIISNSPIRDSSRLVTLPPLVSSEGRVVVEESKSLNSQQSSTITRGIKSNSNYRQQETHNNIIYPFTDSLISAACSPTNIPCSYGYRSEISRTIDTSSSIFYTVPRPRKKDLLGTPSILQSFRQLEEPTRFITALSKAKLASAPNIYTPPVRLLNKSRSITPSNFNSRKKRISGPDSASDFDPSSSRSTPATESSERQLVRSSFGSLTQDNKFKQGSNISAKMLRVRMRRDEYYYTDTSTKSTQTDDKELTLEKRRNSSIASTTTNSGRRSGKSVEKHDRSTSPITPISSAQYLKKIEDLEKITGHFVIQRFFTRTVPTNDQNFGTWLEQQLAVQQQQSNSKSDEEVQVESLNVGNVDEEEEKTQLPSEIKFKSDEIETENVPLLEGSIAANDNDLQQTQMSFTDQDEIIDEMQQSKEQQEQLISVPLASSSDYLNQLEEQIEDPIFKQGIVETVQIHSVPEETNPPQISDEPRPPVIDEIDEVIEDESPQETEQQLTTVRLEPLGEGQEMEGSEQEIVNPLEIASTREKQCKLSDPVPCECFAKFFLHEESIAKLLISLSPRTSTPIANVQDMMDSPFPSTTTPGQISAPTDPLETFEKFEAALQKKSHNENSRHSGKRRQKIKHSGSLPCESIVFPSLTLELDHTITVMSMEGQGQNDDAEGAECDTFPFQFSSPHLRHLKKSISVDSCLGTSQTTSNGSATGPLGHEKTGGELLENLENLDVSQDSHSQALEDLKASIEEEITSNKDSGLGGSSGRSNNWLEDQIIIESTGMSSRQETEITPMEISSTGTTQVMSEPSLQEERSLVEEIIFPSTSSSKNIQKSILEHKDIIISENEIYSAESDTESEIIMSENYHASDAESDTEATDGGDAVADGQQNLDDGDDDNTDVDDDDKDNALLARMELDELRLEMEKPLIRTTCTQTNRSLFSSAWSNGTATSASTSSTTTNGSAGSYIDLEVISKKLPVGPLEGHKRNYYLPSSSSSLNFVNCSMNFSMNMKSEESRIKMSVNLPGGTSLNHRKPFVGRQSIPRKLQALHAKNDKEQHLSRDKDLTSLWAHVRNRLDSKVSLDPPPVSDLPIIRGDGMLGESKGNNATRVGRDDRRGWRERERTLDRSHERGYQRPQHHPSQHSLPPSKVHNDDRIKRSLERLSKLLDKKNF